MNAIDRHTSAPETEGEGESEKPDIDDHMSLKIMVPSHRGQSAPCFPNHKIFINVLDVLRFTCQIMIN